MRDRFQSPNRVKPLSNISSFTSNHSHNPRFNRPIASNLFPTSNRELAHIEEWQFQSPNRVKPLSNSLKIISNFAICAVSIAQSRQTSFQPSILRNAPAESSKKFQSPNRVKPLSNLVFLVAIPQHH